MLGPLANSACIVLGAVAGSLCGASVSPAFRSKMMMVFSCCALGIGVTMTAKVNALPPVIASILVGTLLGEALRLEHHTMRAALKLAALFPSRNTTALPEQSFRDQFAVAAVLFCVSGLGIMGAIREGMTGDPALLLVKSLLDLPTAMLFASSMGAVAGTLAAPQLLLQGVILVAAKAAMPLTTPAMLADFGGCGGIILLGTGLRMCGLLEVPILSMLPSLLLVMPASALWAMIM